MFSEIKCLVRPLVGRFPTCCRVLGNMFAECDMKCFLKTSVCASENPHAQLRARLSARAATGQSDDVNALQDRS